MKKMTAPLVFALLLIAHVGFLVATEDAYTFRHDEVTPAAAQPKAPIFSTSYHPQSPALPLSEDLNNEL